MRFETWPAISWIVSSDASPLSAAPKSINEETGFLLRLLGEQGDFIRAKLRRKHALKLKVRGQISIAYTLVEKAAMLADAQKRRSRAIYPALMLGLHVGMRDSE